MPLPATFAMPVWCATAMPRISFGITQSTCRLRDSGIVEAIIIAGAVMLSTALVWSVSPHGLPAWHYAETNPSSLSPAGLWNQFVSMPILLMLILGWFWRLALWTRFLWLVSRLDLRLVPSHPDGAAGLKFLGMSLHALALPAFALGVVPAGTIVNQVLNDHVSVLSFQHAIIIFAIIMMTAMVGPLFLFSGQLLTALRLRHDVLRSPGARYGPSDGEALAQPPSG